jgi:O-antigen/teichoic acid export membrane protein
VPALAGITLVKTIRRGETKHCGAAGTLALRRDSLMFRAVRLDVESRGSMLNGGALAMAGVVFQGVSRFATSLLVGRLGGPTALGLLASALSTAQLLSLFWPISTGGAASKFVARARGRRDAGEASAIARHLRLRTLQATVVLGLAAVPVWMTVDNGDLVGGLCVAIMVVGYSGYSFTRGLHFGAAQVLRATEWDLATGTLGIIGVTVALALSVRGVFLVLPLAVAAMTYTIACWPWRARGAISTALQQEVDKFVALATIGTLASAGFLQLSVVAARIAGGSQGAGQYAAAFALAFPLSIVAGSLSLVLYPAMSRAVGRGDYTLFRRQTDYATRFLALGMVTAVGCLTLCSRSVISIVWGVHYQASGKLLPVLLFAVLVTTLGVPSVNSLTSRTQKGIIVATSASVVGLTVGALLWMFLAPWIGVLGIAVGYLSGSSVMVFITMSATWYQDRHLWGDLAVRAGAAAALLTFAVVLQHVIPLSHRLDVPLALAFSTLWLTVSRNDMRLSIDSLRRRGPHD